ncbi:hypothetical protein KUTeg_008386 [Tegillarca granosa]|uniref:Tyr recombinase domain-containing protein n=1 Tax=Tegillarca granosa TaxID=220873 RepID=A0ABQ9FC42_TEGGR|nr:hypothetical protein KUTeg_008386 [Tegillarca granosa]
MCQPDSPFFLSVNAHGKPGSTWFKSQPLGVNKVYSIMKDMKIGSGLQTDKNLTNYSARNHLVQKLCDSGVPPNKIVQVTGHKNVNSLNNYKKENPHSKVNKENFPVQNQANETSSFSPSRKYRRIKLFPDSDRQLKSRSLQSFWKIRPLETSALSTDSESSERETVPRFMIPQRRQSHHFNRRVAGRSQQRGNCSLYMQQSL